MKFNRSLNDNISLLASGNICLSYPAKRIPSYEPIFRVGEQSASAGYSQ